MDRGHVDTRHGASLFKARYTSGGPWALVWYFCVRLRPYLRDPCVWWLRELRLPRCMYNTLVSWIVAMGENDSIVSTRGPPLWNRSSRSSPSSRESRVGKKMEIRGCVKKFGKLSLPIVNCLANLPAHAAAFEDRTVLLLEIWRKRRLQGIN